MPSVAQRVPQEPNVVRLEESGRQIGRHGGVLNTLMARSKDVRLMVVYGYARLVKFNRKLELGVSEKEMSECQKSLREPGVPGLFSKTRTSGKPSTIPTSPRAT